MILSVDAESQSPKKMEYTPLELLKNARNSPSPKKTASFYLEFDRRLSLPIVCLLLIFMGTPLALLAGKSGRLGGLALGLFVFTAYYILLIYGENLVMSGRIPHFVGAWMPTVLLGSAALYLFRKESSS